MTEVFEIDRTNAAAAELAIHAASEAIARGALVVFPTDTVYGIACRPDDPDATASVFRAKRRPAGLNLPVLAPDNDNAWRIAEPNEPARILARAFWPGVLTLLLPRTPHSAVWHLGEAVKTIGVRVPDDAVVRSLLARTGPLAATSANVSGSPPIADPRELRAAFGDAVAVYLIKSDGGAPAAGIASTVVDLTGDSPRVVRHGALSNDELAAALAPSWRLETTG